MSEQYVTLLAKDFSHAGIFLVKTRGRKYIYGRFEGTTFDTKINISQYYIFLGRRPDIEEAQRRYNISMLEHSKRRAEAQRKVINTANRVYYTIIEKLMERWDKQNPRPDPKDIFSTVIDFV
ncbi:MAG: hypothetical protein QXT64_07900 [Desulfurococcaceae archaeon]